MKGKLGLSVGFITAAIAAAALIQGNHGIPISAALAAAIGVGCGVIVARFGRPH